MYKFFTFNQKFCFNCNDDRIDIQRLIYQFRIYSLCDKGYNEPLKQNIFISYNFELYNLHLIGISTEKFNHDFFDLRDFTYLNSRSRNLCVVAYSYIITYLSLSLIFNFLFISI